jgi:hypothetical protein
VAVMQSWLTARLGHTKPSAFPSLDSLLGRKKQPLSGPELFAKFSAIINKEI